MTRDALILLPVLLIAACGEGAPVNPPTDPAQGVASSPAVAAAPNASTAPMLPGAGPTSFVGRWTADVAWCAAPQGDRRPIEITPTRFEGYENGCDILSVNQIVDGYEARLRCQSEGTVSTERARFQVSGQTLRLTWLDRGGEPVELTKCTTLADTTTRAPSL